MTILESWPEFAESREAKDEAPTEPKEFCERAGEALESREIPPPLPVVPAAPAPWKAAVPEEAPWELSEGAMVLDGYCEEGVCWAENGGEKGVELEEMEELLAPCLDVGNRVED